MKASTNESKLLALEDNLINEDNVYCTGIRKIKLNRNVNQNLPQSKEFHNSIVRLKLEQKLHKIILRCELCQIFGEF